MFLSLYRSPVNFISLLLMTAVALHLGGGVAGGNPDKRFLGAISLRAFMPDSPTAAARADYDPERPGISVEARLPEELRILNQVQITRKG